MLNLFKKQVYADTAAATPVSKRVMKAMLPFMNDIFYNASSLYPHARVAKEALEKARKDIAGLLSVQSHTITFTSGGTEAAHLAILGTISKAKEKGVTLPHIVASSFEHAAVDELLTHLHKQGTISLTKVDPEEDGIVRVQQMLDVLHTDTVLVCLMAINNEIGTIQPVRKLSSEIKKIREKHRSMYPFVYSDAAQAPQAIGINRDQLGADLISFDSAKIYGPKGIGCLYTESHVAINPIQYGGGQERGMRSGTEPLPLIIGFAEAMKETVEIQNAQVKHHRAIQKYFVDSLARSGLEHEINGSLKDGERIPQNLNVCFKKNGQPINSEFLTIALGEKGIMVSPGASCTSNKVSASSQALEVMGKNVCASSSIRFTFGREASKKDIDYIIRILIKIL